MVSGLYNLVMLVNGQSVLAASGSSIRLFAGGCRLDESRSE